MTKIEIEIKQKYLKLETMREEFKQALTMLVNTASDEKHCPLNIDGNHYQVTEDLFGQGRYKWVCPICNTEHQE